MLLTIVLTFYGAAACYRVGTHMNVTIVVDMLPERARRVADFLVEMLMVVFAMFMVVYGVRLCVATWYNTIAEFPALSVGVAYPPIPFGGVVTLLFVIEHLAIGARPRADPRHPPPVD